MKRALPTGRSHVAALVAALGALDTERLDRWGATVAEVCGRGGRLLVAGNGGSAAQAQHLTAELVGRYRDDRQALSAIALHAETSTLTAVANDFGYDDAFARQVAAHGRPGDILLVLSTSGASPNLLRALEAADGRGIRRWALTGAGPNPCTQRCEESLCVVAPSTATVQEVHQVAVHLICAAVDVALGASAAYPDEIGLPR